jgi:hypothetical protein
MSGATALVLSRRLGTALFDEHPGRVGNAALPKAKAVTHCPVAHEHQCNAEPLDLQHGDDGAASVWFRRIVVIPNAGRP